MLISARLVHVPENDIYVKLASLGLNTWGADRVFGRDYLIAHTERGSYGYPYSLPQATIGRIADRLNGEKMWYRDYNSLAMKHFDQNGAALNLALKYWETHGQETGLPMPEIMPIDGLKSGDAYFAIIGLFHLPGHQNNGNHHLYFDCIDAQGNRLFGTEFRVEWEGITPEQIAGLSPIRIDKPTNEPGANFGMKWEQILYGFFIDNIPVDRFRGVHIRYEDDGEGNSRGHHSHYIVLQKRFFSPPVEPPIEPPEPPELPVEDRWWWAKIVVKKSYVDSLPVDKDGNVTIEGNCSLVPTK
jgi:hypothetical protein